MTNSHRFPSKLKTPRAAAVAGILFSILLLSAFLLLFSSMPAIDRDKGEWLGANSWKVTLALNLIPFAGISFLWFIGVLRDRLGPAEDKLFATVFLGSGLLLIGLLFVAASVIGATLITHAAAPAELRESPIFLLARSLAYHLTTIYALKMSGVFLMTTSYLVIGTGITARWTGVLGYMAAAIILVGSQFMHWTFFVFPVWVLVVSINILIENYRDGSQANEGKTDTDLSSSKTGREL